jgi:hypothetical protein
MKWKPAPLIKVYEALGSIGDGRFEVNGNTAKVYSSSGNKYYDVIYDPEKQAITANDNGSYWVGYLGYPSIVLLLALSVIKYDPKLAEYLSGFAWKDINQKFKNDFDKTQAYIDQQLAERYGIDLERFHSDLQAIQTAINVLNLNKLATDQKPPEEY